MNTLRPKFQVSVPRQKVVKAVLISSRALYETSNTICPLKSDNAAFAQSVSCALKSRTRSAQDVKLAKNRIVPSPRKFTCAPCASRRALSRNRRTLRASCSPYVHNARAGRCRLTKRVPRLDSVRHIARNERPQCGSIIRLLR